MTLALLPDDLVLPFQLDSSSSKGRLVRLGGALNMILHAHDYPEKVAHLLGETTALCAALAMGLKFDGVFTLQVKSEGAVRLLVADVMRDGSVRAYAQYDAEMLQAGDALLGKGYLAFTVDQPNTDERYQGIVQLEGDNLAEAVQHYFKQSEQIPTGLIAAVKCDENGVWRAGALMLQEMPREGGTIVQTDTSKEDDWRRAMIFMQSCTPEELTDAALPSEDLLYRLFHQEDVRVYPAQPMAHKCRCSAERVTNMLKGLPKDEIEALAVDGLVKITCEFCNNTYSFNAEERAALWSE